MASELTFSNLIPHIHWFCFSSQTGIRSDCCSPLMSGNCRFRCFWAVFIQMNTVADQIQSSVYVPFFLSWRSFCRWRGRLLELGWWRWCSVHWSWNGCSSTGDINNFILDFGVFFISSCNGSGAGVTEMSTSFFRGRFLPDFLSFLFKLLLKRCLKLTSEWQSFIGRPTNMRTANIG